MTYPTNEKMYCAQDNRIYSSDCNKSYIPNIYSNHLKSKGNYINVMKKRCNIDITHCDNHDLTCSMNKLSLKSNDTIKTDFSNVKVIIKGEQSKEKYIDSDILLLKFRNFHDSKSITEAKAVLQKLYIFMGITWGEFVFCHDGYAYKRIKM